MPDQEEKTVEAMRITKKGRGFYDCASETHPETNYSVDLFANEGLGSCTCLDFTTRRFPRYRKNGKRFDIYRCKHLRRVRNHVLDQILTFYGRAEKEPGTI